MEEEEEDYDGDGEEGREYSNNQAFIDIGNAYRRLKADIQRQEAAAAARRRKEEEEEQQQQKQGNTKRKKKKSSNFKNIGSMADSDDIQEQLDSEDTNKYGSEDGFDLE